MSYLRNILNKSTSHLKLVYSINNSKLLISNGISSQVRCLSSLANKSNNENNSKNSKSWYYKTLSVFGGVLLGFTAYNKLNNHEILAAESNENHGHHKKVPAGIFRKDLPTFTDKDVQNHNSMEKGIWVTYKNGVYDITKFVESHPGGNKILLGAGTSIEPFWHIYPVHYTSETFAMLEEHRIGNLEVTEKKVVNDLKVDDPFKNDPPRHPLLKPLSTKPYNAETPVQLSVDSIITPNELHFKRNHLPVPKIDLENYKLEIVNNLTNEKKQLSLEDIRTKFPIHKIAVTLQCAGNRRKEMHGFKPVQGLMWETNAISTAEWTGVKLKDILEYCGFDVRSDKVKHVLFEGLDHDPSGATYGASIPKEKVENDIGDVLVAFQMNGQDIPLDHGFPLRLIAPGIIGARSVKWLSKVLLSETESNSHWQRNDYKLLSPTVKSLNEADFSKLRAVQESPIQSAICEPQNGAVIEKDDETLLVKGYAYSGGGQSIDSVMISLDDGVTWKIATLKKLNQPIYRAWAWTLWEAEVEIPKNKDSIQITCVATDSSENTQPETVKSIWNLRGLLNNSWHKINVQLK